ncbi:hypothetical protein ACFLZB_03540 [Nanoarchaeota archaeon]
MAVVVAIAGTWFNLQSMNDSTYLTGLGVSGGTGGFVSSTAWDAAVAAMIAATNINAVPPTQLAAAIDCSHHSGNNMVTGETSNCTSNATLTNLTMTFAGNVDYDANYTGDNTQTLNTTYQIGYCSLSPDTKAAIIDGAWAVTATAGSTDEAIVLWNATAGSQYTLSCEHGIGVGWNETVGVATFNATVEIYDDTSV